jgi:hypothetical protein
VPAPPAPLPGPPALAGEDLDLAWSHFEKARSAATKKERGGSSGARGRASGGGSSGGGLDSFRDALDEARDRGATARALAARLQAGSDRTPPASAPRQPQQPFSRFSFGAVPPSGTPLSHDERRRLMQRATEAAMGALAPAFRAGALDVERFRAASHSAGASIARRVEGGDMRLLEDAAEVRAETRRVLRGMDASMGSGGGRSAGGGSGRGGGGQA